MTPQQIEELGYFEPRYIEGQGWCALAPMMFTVGIACGLDPVGLRYRYCYTTASEARHALSTWNGEGHPPGSWIKRKGEGGDLINPAIATSHDR